MLNDSLQIPVLSLNQLKVSYNRSGKLFNAVNGVSLQLFAGQTMGLVGESGCGKSSLALALMKLIPFEGEILYKNIPLHGLSESDFRPYRQKIQMIFQNPASSLNPKLKIKESLSEALALGHPKQKSNWQNLIAEKLLEVGLDPDTQLRYPHEFSGGQLQRIGIARALCVNPEVLICDEPVSSLDVSIQAQILELFTFLKARHQLSILFISHDLRVVRYLADHVAVMHKGAIIENGPTEKVFDAPTETYTKSLLAAIPPDLN